MQAMQNKAVDRMFGTGLGLRQVRSFHRLEGPVPGVGRAFGDPAFQRLFFERAQRVFVLRRRHQFVRVGGKNPLHQLALFGLAGHDAEVAAEIGERAPPRVEPVVGGIVLVRSMAGKAFGRKNRAHIAAEVQRLLGQDRSGQEQACQKGCQYMVHCFAHTFFCSVRLGYYH